MNELEIWSISLFSFRRHNIDLITNMLAEDVFRSFFSRATKRLQL